MRLAAVMRASLAAALVGAALVPAAAGAEDPRVLIVEGSSSAFVDFEVADDEQLQVDFDGVKVTGGRTFAAVHISSLESDSSFTVGAIKASWLAPEAEPFGGSLLPGKYRARLLTDGPAKATFPLQKKGRSFFLRPSTPLQVGLRWGEQNVAAGLSQSVLRLDDAVPAHWQAVFAFRVTGDRVEQTSACVTTESRCPSLPLAPPLVSDPGIASGFPSRETGVQAREVPAAAVARDALVGLDGYRSSAGIVRSFVVTFRESSQ